MKIVGVKQLKGEGSILLVRNKQRLGYELSMVLEVEEGATKSELAIEELCDDSEEVYKYRGTGAALANKTKVLRLLKKVVEA